MRVVARCADPVRLSFLQALLTDAGIPSLVLDEYISAAQGNIGVFPPRLAVAEEDGARAVRVLREAGEA